MSEQVAEQKESTKMTLKEQEDALRDGRIVGFECSECGVRRLTPMVRCPQGHENVFRKEFAATGVVETYTIQHVASEAFMNEVPFAWAIIKLDDGGPRVSGWIAFVRKPEDLPVGAKVKFTSSYKPGMQFEKVA